MLAEVEFFEEEFTGCLPVERTTFEATGLDQDLLIDLILKTIYQRGPQNGYQLSDHLRLPLSAIQEFLAEQRRLHVLEVLGSDRREFGDGAYIYALTDEGGKRANKALARSAYVGPAPVTFEEYVASVNAQSVQGIRVDAADLAEQLSDLTINESVLDEIGPAVNAASSIFFFGAPGNGKTSVATRIVRLLGEEIYVPYAIEVEGSIIEFYDPVVHLQVENGDQKYDRRWMKIQRPAVVAGGELTMDSLDLHFSESRRTYQAPYQMKANCGMFLIDDFGRQAMNPHQLLNRLIVPLEQRVDYLTLMTGTKLEVPFDEIVIFSTNLDPSDLADEAFLRRIKYKIHLEDPSPVEFRQIFQGACQNFHIPFDGQGFDHLISKHYKRVGRPFRAVHPRDLLDQMSALSRYKGTEPAMTPDMIDRVVRTYFATERD